MQPIKDTQGQLFAHRRALMRLKDEFEQRKVVGEPGHPFWQMIPLPSPSGAQWVGSALEVSAVNQIAFVPTFYDLISRPIIRYELRGAERVYTPDLACMFQSVKDPHPGRFVIETKPRAELERRRLELVDRFSGAREMCKQMGAAFRVLHEEHLESGYHRNALHLAPQFRRDPDFTASDLLQEKFGGRRFAKREGEEALREIFDEPWKCAEAMDVLIAWRLIYCDLMQDISKDSELRFIPHHESDRYPDPFLNMLQTMDPDVGI